MRIGFPLAIPPIFFLATACNQHSDVKNAVITAFASFQKAEIIGIPDGKELNKIKPFLSQRLINDFLSANKVEIDYYKQLTEPEPPLSEGWNLFFGVYEGATSFKVLKCQVHGLNASVIMEFTYQDSTSTKPDIWQRKIFLIHEAGRWVFDDLIDIPKSGEKSPTTLRAQLSAFILTKGNTIQK